MRKPYKVLLISDDKENVMYNRFQEANTSEYNSELYYSGSSFDDLKMNLRRDFYIIIIDYDDLENDVNQIVDFIREYLYSLPLIIVMSYDESVFDRTKIPHVMFADRKVQSDRIREELSNALKIMRYDRTINDVSHFPGNFVINEIMDKKIRNNDDFSIAYIDIDKFKSFTDYYGLYRASKLIRYLSGIILDLIDDYGSIEDFIGHVGGDDFVIIFNDYRVAETVSNKLIEIFDKNVKYFYDLKDLENGYIEVLNRQGSMEKFPVISLSIVNVSNENKDYSSTDEIYLEMIDIKKEAKQTMGSVLLHS